MARAQLASPRRHLVIPLTSPPLCRVVQCREGQRGSGAKSTRESRDRESRVAGGETVEFKSNSILFLQPLHLREASRTYQKASFLWWAVNLLSGALRPPVKPQPSTA